MHPGHPNGLDPREGEKRLAKAQRGLNGQPWFSITPKVHCQVSKMVENWIFWLVFTSETSPYSEFDHLAYPKWKTSLPCLCAFTLISRVGSQLRLRWFLQWLIGFLGSGCASGNIVPVPPSWGVTFIGEVKNNY